jgi:hypothetical protein
VPNPRDCVAHHAISIRAIDELDLCACEIRRRRRYVQVLEVDSLDDRVVEWGGADDDVIDSRPELCALDSDAAGGISLRIAIN